VIQLLFLGSKTICTHKDGWSFSRKGEKPQRRAESKERMRAMRNLFKIFVIVAATAGLAQGAVIFQDTFENNVVTNSDSVNGFWKVTATGAGFSITETNGVLDMQTTSDVSGRSELLQLGSVSAQSDFDFFSKQLTFSADVVSQGGTVGDVQSELRFALHTGSGYEFNADDFFHILIQKGNNVYVQQKINGTATTISNINYNTHVSRFDLTLDNSGWSLDLTDTNRGSRVTSRGQ
jgi:hypothetical protein